MVSYGGQNDTNFQAKLAFYSKFNTTSLNNSKPKISIPFYSFCNDEYISLQFKKLKESKLILVRSINSVQIIAGTDVLAILFKLNSVFF
jgi:hypothetical protein